MSVSPAQKRSNPPPVPEMPTSTLTPGCTSRNASAAAVVSGPTVLEPSTITSPESGAASVVVSAEAAVSGLRLSSPVVVPATPAGAERQDCQSQEQEDDPRNRTNSHGSPFALLHRGECRRRRSERVG